MFTYLFKAFSFAAIAVYAELGNYEDQTILQNDDAPSNFIASSMFGRRLIDAQLSGNPEFLPPRYSTRGFEDDYPYEGIGTFAHLEFVECTKSQFDIGIVGHPFDLGVSYRPGARFGPSGGRRGARRLSPVAGWE
jgi:agmatinase